VKIIVACLLALLAWPAAAAEQRYARITVLAPREGMQKEFEEGYKRHLEWHRAHADRWTWYGWTVTTGERFGTFIDGTFDHPAADFDAAVAPADDAADNAKNVLPYARIVSTAIYRVLRGSPAVLNAPFIALRSLPAKASRDAIGSEGEALRLELVSGGEEGSLLVFIPEKSVSALASRTPDTGLGATIEALRLRADLTYRP
jgi:hypothetical protein